MKPILVVNPTIDEVFGAFAQTIVDHGSTSPVDLEARLRVVYPLAVVHAREIAAERFLIWYVYREGHWIASRPITDSTGAQDYHARPTGRPSIDRGIDPPRR